MSLEGWLLLLLLLFSAFFSGTETAYTVAGRLALEVYGRHDRRGARRALRFHARPNLLFSTTLVMNNLVNVAYSSLAALILAEAGVPLEGILVISPLLLLFFGEVLPKAIARERAEGWALLAAGPLWTCYILFLPAIWLTRVLSRALQSLFGVKGGEVRGRRITFAELTAFWGDLKRAGSLEKGEAELIDHVVALRRRRVRDVMTPRTSIVALPEDAGVAEAEHLVRTRGFSRIPLYRDNLDSIVGVLLARDLLRRPASLSEVMRRPAVVPEQAPAIGLLKLFRRGGTGLAVVIDEYGGTAGIVSLEDLLEEIVGEIEDEHDRRGSWGRQVAKDSLLVSGQSELERLHQRWGIQLPEGEYETVSGLILDRLGHIPEVGEQIEAGGWRLRVVSADAHRIKRVLLRRAQTQGAARPGG